MRKLAGSVAIVAAAFFAFAETRTGPAPLGPKPVVLELFTSQGCSSCPPAEELLRAIAADPATRGRVIPLAYHVDYWDGAGWRDPFSSRQWTARQMAYVREMKLPSAYTPQTIVNGRKQMVGSNAAAVREAIAEASSGPDASHVKLTVASGRATVESGASRAGLELIVVVTEDGLVTRVAGGENGGRTLGGDPIVRRFIRAGAVAQGEATRTVDLRIDPQWHRDHLSVVAFLQDPESLAIEGAGSVALR